MIGYLTTYFKPQEVEAPEFSLSISSGREGARLTHNHERQYNYVLQARGKMRDKKKDERGRREPGRTLTTPPGQFPHPEQSLTLWSEVMTSMFKLWTLTEMDMLAEGNSYKLGDTGQGLNRMQDGPRVYREMTRIIGRCQQRIGHWVGSQVVHLGDHNVSTQGERGQGRGRGLPCPACLPACLPACRTACRTACLPNCRTACLSVCRTACLSACLPPPTVLLCSLLLPQVPNCLMFIDKYCQVGSGWEQQGPGLGWGCRCPLSALPRNRPSFPASSAAAAAAPAAAAADCPCCRCCC